MWICFEISKLYIFFAVPFPELFSEVTAEHKGETMGRSSFAPTLQGYSVKTGHEPTAVPNIHKQLPTE